MNKSLIKKLAHASYTKGAIDPKKVNRITKSLKKCKFDSDSMMYLFVKQD